MNSYSLRQYWITKFEETYHEPYRTDKANIEFVLLKRLLDKFGQYLLLEATDRFFNGIKKEKASILLFASNKFFGVYYKDLIREKDVIQYQRMLPWYNQENQTKIKKLLQAYRNYLYALSLSQEELDDMSLIVEKLKNIPTQTEREKNATGYRTETNICNY
jgi:hypothetical protein